MRANKIGRWVTRASVAIGLGAAMAGTSLAVAAGSWTLAVDPASVRPADAFEFADQVGGNDPGVFLPNDYAWD